MNSIKLFESKNIRSVWNEADEKWYFSVQDVVSILTETVDAKDYIKLKRRIIRDEQERGYDLEDVLYRYDNHVMPTYETYIKPHKRHADLIIPNHKHFNQAQTVLAAFIRSIL